MINESYYWKKELYENFKVVARFIHLKKRIDQSYVKLEKAILLGAYIIRKLDEANKIPSDFLKRNERLNLFKGKGTVIDILNSHQLDEHYNFNYNVEENRNWGFILNQLIHSYTLVYECDSKDGNGILLNSDNTSGSFLFHIPFELILKIFLSVSEGYLTSVAYERKKKNGKLIMKEATYTYPDGFSVSNEIANTMKGKIYNR